MVLAIHMEAAVDAGGSVAVAGVVAGLLVRRPVAVAKSLCVQTLHLSLLV